MSIPRKSRSGVNTLIKTYEKRLTEFEAIRKIIVDDIDETPQLKSLLHSVRSRVKEPSHLREKIGRKADKYFSRSGRLLLTSENLPFLVNDLVGVRLLHLYIRQFAIIDDRLRQFFNDHRYVIREGPIARVWDNEQKSYYRSLGVDVKDSDKLYSSVHYVIATKDTADQAGITAEIQVRTLADELWGEVDHRLNYPRNNGSAVCREQIAVLARITSGASRLADSIFLSDADWKRRVTRRRRKTPRRRS